ncbi:MAG TPA: LysM domain-containing protein [Ramlibacter sp.]|uniref:LysM peptidoglycan-binding domain-containing protein n=1 Tax=Ramlibacter sp. TaxID=1917967 RepID=UPI002B785FAB|nr:LysM domain-containing protein [Ramlibacter sp.]HVZ47109.1 LysM domain-containing protein [Ramlibacter sp.]
MAHSPATGSKLLANALACAVALALGALAGGPAFAQNYPITPEQRATAQQVAQAGVPLSELAPNAPDSYTVKRGDTLWGISGVFLKSPWRWPELWGMNMEEVHNPHLIYPGQQLYLEKIGDRARLRMGTAAAGVVEAPAPAGETIRVSPRVRYEALADTSIPTLAPHLIEPFLSEPLVVGEGDLDQAPRLVATQDTRVLITRGDRAYARGVTGKPLKESDPRRIDSFRVFRNAVALRDPVTQRVLGYEAKYLGEAELVRGESVEPVQTSGGGTQQMVVPATIDITAAREEMRVGDRLLPEPPRQLTRYVPHAPAQRLQGSIVSVYGDAVAVAGQNQVVAINKGLADGIEVGHVLAILKDGAVIEDRSQDGQHATIKIPDERNGLLMVFRPFEHVSYALILEIGDTVKVGDRVVNPR